MQNFQQSYIPLNFPFKNENNNTKIIKSRLEINFLLLFFSKFNNLPYDKTKKKKKNYQ